MAVFYIKIQNSSFVGLRESELFTSQQLAGVFQPCNITRGRCATSHKLFLV